MAVTKSASLVSGFFVALMLAACRSAPPDPGLQSLVDSLMARHAAVARLSVHAPRAEGGRLITVASSACERWGKDSDPEDARAVATGEVIVLDEGALIDVTIPILMKNGKHTAAVGVTLRGTADRDGAVAEAKAIANEVAAAMARSAGDQ
ncbi:MAG: hypothetical protein Fur0037_05400 [Planctomycetota bacterium]